MKLSTLIPGCIVFLLLSCQAVQTSAQDSKPAETKPPASQQNAPVYRLTLVVTGGEKNVPVVNASVYIKYVEERKIKKDKVTELNVKTNQDGAAHIPVPQLGRVLIQIIAEGWKTHGHWYDLTEERQTIEIHLDRPPKWY
jgi:hypothetical protein